MASHHKEINSIVSGLIRDFHFPLGERGSDWTPSRSRRTEEEKCYDGIKFLYFREPEALEQCLRLLREEALDYPPTQRFEYFHGLIKKKKRSIVTGSGRCSAPKGRFQVIENVEPIPSPALHRHHAPSQPELSFPSTARTSSPDPSIDSFHTSFGPQEIGQPSQSPTSAMEIDSRQDSPVESNEDFDTPPESPTAPYSSGYERANQPFTRKRPSETEANTSPPKMARIPSSLNVSFGSHVTTSTIDASPGPRQVDTSFEGLIMAVNTPNTSFGTESFAENYRVRDMPWQNLFVEDVPEHMSHSPLGVAYDCCRVAIENKMAIGEILPFAENGQGVFIQHKNLWKELFKQARHLTLPPPSPSNAIEALHRSENVSLKGSLSWAPPTSTHKSCFQLALAPLSRDTFSCRLQRKFGADRFLYLNVPVLPRFRSDMPSHLTDQFHLIRPRYQEWLNTPKFFLGRRWRVFHVEEKKDRRRKGYSQDTPKQQQVILFAEAGFRMEHVSVSELINWFMPLKKNLTEKYLKAYARIGLGISKTSPTVVFTPNQIRFVDDKYADGTPEDSQFNDPNIPWRQFPHHPVVMNDGCSRISYAAGQEIWLKTGNAGPIPSVFQARIGGAKGVWVVSAPSDSDDLTQHVKWIEITKQQRKFIQDHDEQENILPLPDSNHTTFEFNRYSRSVTSSDLHVAFFPILEDRGVPKTVLTKIVQTHLQGEKEQILQMIQDPIKIRQWVHTYYSTQSNSDSSITWKGGMPLFVADRITIMLEAGFSPLIYRPLADLVRQLIDARLREVQTNLRVRIGKSTSCIGICDPFGVLRPGEIHISFSTPLETNEVAGESYTSLDKKEVLVARHPAIRRSDIQKVRAVYRPELGFIQDVVVFPAKGQIPLASKLQGGDYDGDTFWLCWEPELAHPFKNAPAPYEDEIPKPEELGIDVDRRQVKDFDDFESFLSESLKFRCQPNFLGLATMYCENIAYSLNSLDHPAVDKLAALHDYLVDSAKNGYTYSQAALDHLLRNLDIPQHHWKQEPAYRNAMKKLGKPQSSTPVGTPTRKTSPPRYDRIIDYVYFEVVKPKVQDIATSVDDVFSRSSTTDSDLEGPLLFELENGDSAIKSELESLEKRLEPLKDEWNSYTHRDKAIPRSQGQAFDEFDQFLMKLSCSYRSFEPENTQHPIIQRWTQDINYTGHFTQWELIKASLLFRKYIAKSTRFVHALVGRELIFIKAKKCGSKDARILQPRMRASLKPKKIKYITPDDVVPSEPSSFEFDEDLSDEDWVNFIEMCDGPSHLLRY